VVTWVLLLSACSTIEVVYGQADRVLSYLVDAYFGLTESQKPLVERQIASLMAWHRRSELPDYADFLADSKTRLERGLRVDDIDWFVRGLETRYRRLAGRLSEHGAPFLATVDERQIERCRAELAERNEDWAAEWHLHDDPAERSAWRRERVLAVAEDWVGTFDERQRGIVEHTVDGLPDAVRERYQDRLRRQQGFLALLAERRGGDEFADQLRDWLLHWDQGRAPEYQKYLDALRERAGAALLELDRSLSPGQRAQLTGRVQDFIDAFRALSSRQP
jgi:hypothetical protein